MTPAFDTIFALLNALLQWAKNDTFLHNTLWQIWNAVEDIQSVHEEKESRIQELEQTLRNTEQELNDLQDEKRYLEDNLVELSVVGQEELLDYAEVIANCETKAHVQEAVMQMCNGNNAATDKLTDLLWDINTQEGRDLPGPTGLADLEAAMDIRNRVSDDEEEPVEPEW